MLGIIPLPFGKPQPQSRRARRVRPAPAPRPDRPAAARSAAMATSPQKSPSVPKSPTPKSPPSRKKDDSFLGKLGGTLARRKKAKEEKLESEKLNVAEVTQSEIAQKQKLQTVLEKINETLKLPPRSIKWNVDTVHAKSLVAILHLLVALSQYFRAPIRLPDHVSIQVVVVQKREGILQSRQIQEEITGNTEALSGRHERDAFDTLFDHAPDKLNVVKKTLITFVNKHLNKLNLEVTELETQFADGVYLVLLMGLLEGYFVPLHSFFLTPDSFEQKVLNVSFAFELMQDGGLEKPKPRPEDIVNCDLKSTLRVLYNLFTKYRNVE
uniref:Parvin alpha n=1 Tax=Ovis aries TaxID=9940 RepID=A0AC11CZY9_SHEEP